MQEEFMLPSKARVTQATALGTTNRKGDSALCLQYVKGRSGEAKCGWVGPDSARSLSALVIIFIKNRKADWVVMHLVECTCYHAKEPMFEPPLPTCRGEAS